MYQLPAGTLVLRKKNDRKAKVSTISRDLPENDDDASRVVFMNKVFKKDIYEVARAALKHDKETFILGPSKKHSDFLDHESLLESHLMPMTSGTISHHIK